MGLEILDEFRPIMSIRTVPVPTVVRSCSQRAEVEKEELLQECHTPTSSKPQTLLVCPPPPKKPRVSRTTRTTFPSHSQAFFQVPHDLASVFLLRAKPSTLTTTSEEALC
ncbi:hypothetical protein AAZX31_13G085200 [Glycine max]|uniref:Uncharacterized protein n=2 Tax=Glycine subgen. Soja TaxID=1462606 RepID=K7LWR9_SOYBN|nr:hypothetical protein JHK87_035780 [Glycine soja]KAG5112587.1 hypothetical protein JHK82_035856 [Glycine max]KAG5129861.1 hypothetical protein JHK84_036258 [Glycine max]KAH1100731.1 hypothetical protein GYH30_035733 [Glycine max]KAH1216268.1 hypothetical protein GmHk_13G037207 [Glycine max]